MSNNEPKGEVKIKLSTLIIIILILVIIGLLGYIVYSSKNKGNISNDVQNESVSNNVKNENISNNIQNESTENKTIQSEIKEQDTSTIKGEKFAQFNNEFYKLKDIAKEYRLSENIKNYKDFNYDLDDDGVEDKITIQKSSESEEMYIFKLNGQEFEKNYYQPEIYIADLNEQDNKLEVVIFDDGPSDDYGYSIYSKAGNKMEKLDQIAGVEFRTDKKGTILIDNNYNGITEPKIYFQYYFIDNSTLKVKDIDTSKIKDLDLKTDWLYFSTDYNNLEKFYNIWINYDNVKDAFKKANIEELNKNSTFKVLEFNVIKKSEEDTVNYKIYVELSDGRKGYMFWIQLAG